MVVVDDTGHRRELEAALLAQDRRVEALQLGARLDAELVDERLPRRRVHLERLGLPPGPVEREHQLRARALAKRVRSDERLELADELGVAAEGEVGVDPLLERREPQLLEARDLVLRERLERATRRAASPARAQGPRGRAVPSARPPPRAPVRRAARTGAGRSRPGRRGGRSRAPGSRRLSGAEQLAQPRSRLWSDVCAAARRPLAPERVDEPVDRDARGPRRGGAMRAGRAASGRRAEAAPRSLTTSSGPRSRNSVTYRL